MSFLSKELKPYLKLSIGFHVGIFLFFGVKVLIFPDLNLDDQGTIKVDMVALPNLEDNKKVTSAGSKPEVKKVETPKEKPAPKPVEKAPVAKKEPEKKKPNPAEPKMDESSAFEKLKEMQAMQKLSQKQEVVETTDDQEGQPTDNPIKGNRLAEGDSISGVSRIQYDNYKQIVHNAVKNKWQLPSWMQESDLFAEALIKINETGHVTEQVLITSSGNSMYDKYVTQAINEASPFPAPPDKFVNIVGVKGVVLRFP